MSDAFLVRGIERGANLRGILQCLIDRQRPLESRALDVLHYKVIGTDIVERTNVGMVQRSDSACFALEALRELFV